MKELILLFICGSAFSAYTIKPDPSCIIKGKIEYVFGGKKTIERPINCAVNEKPGLTFCEGDEVKSPKGKNNMKVLTLIPNEEVAYVFAPNYGHKSQNIDLNTVENAVNFDCAKRLEALKQNIKWVVENEAQFQEKPKEKPADAPAKL